MRIVVTAKALPVHFGKLMSFGRALHRAGHELLIVAPQVLEPVLSEHPAVREDGVPYRLCGDASAADRAQAFRALSHLSNEEAHIQLGNETLVRLGPRAAVPDVLRALREFQPHLVVRDSAQFAGLVAAEQYGVPHVKVRTGSPSTDMSLTYNEESVTELRAEYSLDQQGTPHPNDEPYLTFVPECLDSSETASLRALRRFRIPSAPRGDDRPDWLPDGDHPLVFLSFGTVASTVPYYARFYRPVVESLVGLPIRLAVGLGETVDPADLGPLPGHVVARQWISQEQAMAHAAAVACHGGLRSVLTCLEYGVPLAVSPFFWDHSHNARCVAELGAGIALQGASTAEMLQRLPEALLALIEDNSYRESCRAVAKDIATLPDVEECAAFVESLV
jgi:UDP:flavonoid glycosyltransferase YjiC (YdhE family)